MQPAAKAKIFLFLTLATLQCAAELQECTTACQCEMRATNLANHLGQILEQKIQTLAANGQTALRVLTAAATTHSRPNYLAPIAAIATEELSAQAAKLSTATPVIMEGVQRLKQLASHYQTLNRLSITPHQNSIAGTGGTAWERGTFTKQTLVQHNPADCAQKTTEEKNTGHDLATAKDLKFKDLKLHAGLSMTCARTIGTACSGVSSADKIWAQLELGQTVLATEASPLGNDGNYKRISAGPILNQLITPANVNDNQTQMIAALDDLNTITSFEDSMFFTAKDTLTNFISQQVLGIAPGTTLSTEQQKEQAAQIKANYGTEPTDFQKIIWQQVQHTAATYAGVKTLETKKIEQINSDSDLASAITLSLGKSNSETKAACPTVEESAEQIQKECKAETDKDKCNNKDGCEYKNGSAMLKRG
uniref:Variant surface glycoprotein 1371 n=1 Tax=Trypanosoma brucei TaxID=5691 RepID=M4SV97_9TRYP|nr:variant surface glycoprotein 1371 [Trypanosoma brucei]